MADKDDQKKYNAFWSHEQQDVYHKTTKPTTSQKKQR